MLAQSGISAAEGQGSRKATVSPTETRGSRKEDQSKRKRKSSSTRKHAPEPPSSPGNDATETRPSKRKRTADDVHNEDKENGYGVEHKKAAKNGAEVPKPVVEIRQSPRQQTPKQMPKQTPRKSPKQAPKTPVKTPTQTPKTPFKTPGQTPKQTPDSTKSNRAHGSDKKPTLTGFFSAAEVQQLEAFKLEFCNTNGLSSNAFDEMVQHSDRDKTVEFPCDASIITKPDFWRNIYESMPQRDRRSVYRFMRRHFRASTQKPHEWTREQDDELVSLHSHHGPKWAYIAKLVGRSDDDVVQRWKNRLEHRNTMLRGPWSAEEIRALQSALNQSWKAMHDSGIEVGRDIYEMEETLVGWGHVSERMGYKRSRQQCADKWRRIRKRILDMRDRGNPEATYEPTAEMRSPKKPRAPITVAQEVPKESQYKSSKYVEDDDESEPESPVKRVSTNLRHGPVEELESDSDAEPNQTKSAVQLSRPTGSGSESEFKEPARKSTSADSPKSGSGSEDESESDTSSSGDESEENEESKNEDGASKDRMSLDPVETGDEALNAKARRSRSSSGSESESDSEPESEGSKTEPKVQPDIKKHNSGSGSSDSESELDAESDGNSGSEAKAERKPDAVKAASKSDTSSESEESGSEAKLPQKSQASDSEDTSDSGSESESESESGSEAEAGSKLNTVQKPVGQPDSGSDSDSDSDSSSSKSRPRPRPQSPNTHPESDTSSSGSNSDSDSDSDSSSDSDSDSESEDESNRIKEESRSGSENTFRFFKREDISD